MHNTDTMLVSDKPASGQISYNNRSLWQAFMLETCIGLWQACHGPNTWSYTGLQQHRNIDTKTHSQTQKLILVAKEVSLLLQCYRLKNKQEYITKILCPKMFCAVLVR